MGTRALTPSSLWEPFSPKSDPLNGTTLYIKGTTSPSAPEIDICICESRSQSRSSDIGYVDARSANTVDSTLAKASATAETRCRPISPIVAKLGADSAFDGGQLEALGGGFQPVNR